MTLYIDDSLMTVMITMPLAEGWIETDVPFEVRKGLGAADVGPGDVAVIPGPEATLLGETHIIEPDIGIVTEAVSPIAMRTPVRPDEIEETPIRLLDAGPTADVLMRSLLRPYFGITASSFVRDADDPDAAEARVIVLDGLMALTAPEYGFQEDLGKSWFILTSSAVVHAVTVIGVEAYARGATEEIETLKRAIETGQERRRDVRRAIAGDEEVDRDRLVEITNGTRFSLTGDDRQSLRNMMSRGIWGTGYQRALPAFRDEVRE